MTAPSQFDYKTLQAKAKDIITKFGAPVTISHSNGGQSRGTIVLATHVEANISGTADTIRGSEVVGYIDNVTNEVKVGDSLNAYGKDWRVRESTSYKGPTITLAYRVILDS